MIAYINGARALWCNGHYYRFEDEASDWPDEYDVAQGEYDLAVEHKAHRQPQHAQQEGWDGTV